MPHPPRSIAPCVATRVAAPPSVAEPLPGAMDDSFGLSSVRSMPAALASRTVSSGAGPRVRALAVAAAERLVQRRGGRRGCDVEALEELGDPRRRSLPSGPQTPAMPPRRRAAAPPRRRATAPPRRHSAAPPRRRMPPRAAARPCAPRALGDGPPWGSPVSRRRRTAGLPTTPAAPTAAGGVSHSSEGLWGGAPQGEAPWLRGQEADGNRRLRYQVGTPRRHAPPATVRRRPWGSLVSWGAARRRAGAP